MAPKSNLNVAARENIRLRVEELQKHIGGMLDDANDADGTLKDLVAQIKELDAENRMLADVNEKLKKKLTNLERVVRDAITED